MAMLKIPIAARTSRMTCRISRLPLWGHIMALPMPLQ
jgi:hypothetical protein